MCLLGTHGEVTISLVLVEMVIVARITSLLTRVAHLKQ